MEDLYNKASLVLTPQMVEAGKVYSMKPEDRKGDFTFSRSTAATRVNASGNIEKETGNLLTYSNDFSQWVSNNTSETSGQAGYDGTNDAWLVNITGATSAQRIEKDYTLSGIQTLSVYAKAGSLNWVRLLNLGGSAKTTYFDLSNGVVGSSTAIDANIESVGNGWYRCSMVINEPATRFRIYPATDDGNITQSSGNIYIQDAQLEQGLVTRDVITTTTTAIYGGITDNVPRLDYTDSSCPALLLEPQRTNQINYSEYYGSHSFNDMSLSSNETTSPEGLENAAEIIEGSNNTNHYFRIPNLSWTSGTDVVFSIYLKENTRRYSRLRFDNTGGNTRVWLDLRTGEVTFIDNTDNGVCTSTDVGNGWFRYEFKVTPSNTTAAGSVQVFTQSVESVLGSLQTTYQGDGSSGIYVYGAQVETGSFATSYIPTYGSAVTRNGDKALNENNSNLPTGYPFSLFAEVDVVDTTSGYPISLNWSDSYQHYYALAYYGGYWRILARNVTQTIGTSSVVPSIGVHKVAGIFTETELKLYVDGSLAITLPQGQTFNTNVNDLLVGQLRNIIDDGTRSPIKKSLVFNQALTDQEAIDLTTI